MEQPFQKQRQLGEAAEMRKPAGAASPIIEESCIADARQYNERAIALAMQGKLEEAAAFFRQALRLWPDFAQRTTTWAMLCGSKASWQKQ